MRLGHAFLWWKPCSSRSLGPRHVVMDWMGCFLIHLHIYWGPSKCLWCSRQRIQEVGWIPEISQKTCSPEPFSPQIRNPAIYSVSCVITDMSPVFMEAEAGSSAWDVREASRPMSLQGKLRFSRWKQSWHRRRMASQNLMHSATWKRTWNILF